MRTTIIAAVLVMLAGGLPTSSVDNTVNAQPLTTRQVLADFGVRVDRYAALRRRLEQTTPPMVVSNDWSSIKAAIDALAEKIRTERANAKQGDVFTPEVERWFRQTLVDCNEGMDVEQFLADMNE